MFEANRQTALPRAVDELTQVLSWAMEQRVINAGDRELLIALAIAADTARVTHSGRGRAGLCSHQVASTVARRVGVSPVTIRRRASASLRALAAVSSQIPA